MGCEQSVPTASPEQQSDKNNGGGGLDVSRNSNNPHYEGNKYKGVGGTERMASRARQRAEEKTRQRRAAEAAAAGKGTTSAVFSSGSHGDTSRHSAREGGEPPAPPKLDSLGNLMPEEVVRRTNSSIIDASMMCGRPGNDICIEYAFQTQRGYYPDDPHKENQDEYSITFKFGGEPRDAMFAVYDGHGPHGHECARFARKKLPAAIEKYMRQLRARLYQQELKAKGSTAPGFDPLKWPFLSSEQIQDCCMKAFLEVNEAMHNAENVQDKLSGTTATAVILHGNLVTVANVGDSRVVLGHYLPIPEQAINEPGTDCINRNASEPITHTEEEEKIEIDDAVAATDADNSGENCQTSSLSTNGIHDDGSGQVFAIPLSRDQTPYRRDERERVKKEGAVIMSIDQMEGLEEKHDDWGDLVLGKDVDIRGDPPRIWMEGKDYPGTAFTRSIGDYLAESVGVTAIPEMISARLSSKDRILVIASDGIFEFLTNQQVIDVCAAYKTPLMACQELVKKAYEQWLVHENRTDDITVIVCYMKCKDSVDIVHAKGEQTTEDLVALANSVARIANEPVQGTSHQQMAVNGEKLQVSQ